MIYGALEAGGTKMVAAVGSADGTITEQTVIPTTTPDETMPKVLDFFREKDIAAVGCACFGPIDLTVTSPTYGQILKTPKLPWRFFDIVGALQNALHVPVGFDTDVNGSLLGEVTYGAAKDIQNAVYYTIGTGIGLGAMVNGTLLHGMLHAEGGHILIRRHPDDSFAGCCPSHGTCLEGMASGIAIEKRYGQRPAAFADNYQVWEIESDYLAQSMVSTILLLSPECIILGGGVMHQTQLFPLIRQKTLSYLNGYIDTKQLRDMEHYIIPASLDGNQGILGCLKLAQEAVAQ